MQCDFMACMLVPLIRNFQLSFDSEQLICYHNHAACCSTIVGYVCWQLLVMIHTTVICSHHILFASYACTCTSAPFEGCYLYTAFYVLNYSSSIGMETEGLQVTLWFV